MENLRLNWRNLRRNKCPKCNDDLHADSGSAVIECSNLICDFSISEERFMQLGTKMNKESMVQSDFQQFEDVEDIKKVEECSFCHSRHREDDRCEGFG